jgi:hypothetical protein
MKPKNINELALAGKGFWSRFVPTPIREALRKWFLFAPDDPWDMNSLPPANVKLPGTRHTAYRTPAPGTASLQEKKLVREFEKDRIFDNTDYTHMAANLPPATLDNLSSEFNLRGDEEAPQWVRKALVGEDGKLLEEGEEGSKGEGNEVYEVIESYGSPRRNVNPAVQWYDPQGLRTTFNTSYDAMYKAVLRNTSPDGRPPHWPLPKATKVVMMQPEVKDEWLAQWKARNEKYARCASNPEGTNFGFLPPTMDRSEFHQPFPLNEDEEEEKDGQVRRLHRYNY